MSASCLASPPLAHVDPASLARGVAATPLDQFVIWDGATYEGKPGSRSSAAFALVTEAWRPISMRDLVVRAARLDGERGIRPDATRDAIRQHQGARGASYLWVRRNATGEYVLVNDVPFPSAGGRPMAAGTMVLGRQPLTTHAFSGRHA